MENVELTIVSNGMNGEGIARENGKVFFVDGAVEGDVACVQVLKQNKNFNTAKLQKIVTPSVHRVEPKCKYFGVCGGCSLQHINYQQQLKIKTQNVQNLFNKQKLNVNVLDCEADEQFFYRNKITLFVNEQNRLCFCQKNSNKLVPINYCWLVNENFNKLIQKLNAFLDNNLEYNNNYLKALAIRQIGDVYLINAVLSKKISLTKLQKYLENNKINFSLYFCVNSKNNMPTYPCVYAGGMQEVFLQEYNIKYPVYPMSFLQVNNNVKYKMYNEIITLINGFNYVLDAYSGAGLLSGILSRVNKNVVAVEIDKSASLASKKLCKINNISNLKCVCADCAIELPLLLANTQFNCILLDPARSGVDQNVLNAIVKSNVKNVVYMSCNPATLARDLKILTDGGYGIKYAKPFDMFPQTSNVEVLVQLQK